MSQQAIPRQYLEDTIVPMPIGRTLVHRYPFYCVHSISGNALAEFHYLAEFLAPHVPLLAIQVPKAQRTAATGSSLLALATHYCDELMTYHRQHYPGWPFFLGGWSAGAIVALEMARQLSNIGWQPMLLIAIDKCPRHTRAEIGPWNHTPRNVWLWLKRSWRNSDTSAQAVRSLGSKLWLVVRHGQLYGGPDSQYSSAEVIADLTSRARSAHEREFIQAFYNQTTAYVPQPYPGRVLVLVTEDGYRDRVIEGWREIAEDRTVVRIPGTHNGCMLGTRIGGRHQRDLGAVKVLASELHFAMGMS